MFSPYFEDENGILLKKSDVLDQTAVFVEHNYVKPLADRGMFDTFNKPIQYMLNKSEEILPLDNSPAKVNVLPLVRQEEEYVYNFTLDSFFQMSFGFLDGALNTLPQGGFLQQCGVENKVQREALRKVFNFLLERKLHDAIKELYTVLKQVKRVSYFCYWGTKQYLGEKILTLFTELDILNNIVYNLGYMWTDFVMLIVVQPGYTQSDLLYYIFFYIGDFIFRFIFKKTTDGYCWLPWNNCSINVLTYDNQVVNI